MNRFWLQFFGRRSATTAASVLGIFCGFSLHAEEGTSRPSDSPGLTSYSAMGLVGVQKAALETSNDPVKRFNSLNGFEATQFSLFGGYHGMLRAGSSAPVSPLWMGI